MKLRLLVFLLLSLVTSTRSSAQTDWTWSNPYPQGNHLWGMVLDGRDTFFAVGDAHTILRQSGNSQPIVGFVASSRTTLRAISRFRDTLVAVGDTGKIFVSADRGTTWVNKSINSENQLTSVLMADKLNGSVVGYKKVGGNDVGFALATANGGNTWTAQQMPTNGPQPPKRINDVALLIGDSKKTLFAVGDQGYFMQGPNLGKATWTWLSVGTNLKLRAIATDSSHMFFVGDGGYFQHRDAADPAGVDAVLGVKTLHLGNTLYDVAYKDAPVDIGKGYVIVVGAGGRISYSDDYGGTFLSATVPVTFDIHHVELADDFLSSGVAWAVGQNGVILRSSNYGASWERKDDGPRNHINAMAMSPNGDRYGVSNSAKTLKRRATGSSWTLETIGTGSQNFLDINFDPSGFGLIANNSDGVQITLDSGRTWRANKFSGARILGVATTDSTTGVAVGGPGKIFVTHNRGVSWDTIPTTTIRDFLDVDGFGESISVVGTFGEGYYSTNGGETFTAKAVSDLIDMNRVRFSTARHAIAVGNIGTIRRTVDGGANWTSVTSRQSVTLRDIQWHDNINGIIVGDAGTSLRTVDTGKSWTSLISRTPQNLYGAIILSGDEAMIGGREGVILYTENSMLPVELLSLYGHRLDGTRALIQWKVASERDNFGYRVERLSGNGWSELGFVFGAGTLASERTYRFQDKDAGALAHRYRVVQIDVDGTETSLGEVEISAFAGDTPEIAVYPNPARDRLMIVGPFGSEGPVKVSIFNAVGQLVLSADAAGSETLELTIGQLPAGFYRAVVETTTGRYSNSLTIAR